MDECLNREQLKEIKEIGVGLQEDMATPAGYLIGGAIGAYLIVLAGIGALLGMAIGITIHAQGGNVAATDQTLTEHPPVGHDRRKYARQVNRRDAPAVR